MPLNQWRCCANNQRAFYLSAFAFLLLATAMFAGCGGNPQQTGNTNSGQSNTTPTPSPTPIDKRGIGDTPIVVTGGSVHMDIGKDGDGNGEYKCATCSFKDITILDNDAEDSEDPTATNFDSTLEWRITLTLDKGSTDGKKTVTLVSLLDGTGVTITLPEQKNGETAKVHKFKFRKFLGFIKRHDKVKKLTIESRKPGGAWATAPGFPSLPDKFSMVLTLNK